MSSRIFRNRQAGQAEHWDRLRPEQPPTVQRELVEVYDGGSMPTTTPRIFFTHPIVLDGGDGEGVDAVATADTNVTLPVVFLGGVPAAGERYVAHALGGRWIAEKRGGGAAPTWGYVFTVYGCQGPLPDATVTVWSDEAHTQEIGSGVTDELGMVSVEIPYAEGMVYWRASKDRFVSSDESEAAGPGCYSDICFLVPEAGYFCRLVPCADPLPTTLTYTDVNGEHTLTHNEVTGYWECGYSAGDYDFLVGFDSSLAIQWKLSSEPEYAYGNIAFSEGSSCNVPLTESGTWPVESPVAGSWTLTE